MSKPETTLRIRFETLAMFRLAKKVSKLTLRMFCMSLPSRIIWSRSAKLLNKACKFDSTKTVASSKKRADSSLADEAGVECSFSICTR